MQINLQLPEIRAMLQALNNRKAIVIAGTGVSSATIDSQTRSEIGTWTSLLNYGIKFCCDQCRKEENWGETCRLLLANENTSTEELLRVGDEIWDCLEEHGKISEWLKKFEDVSPEYRELILTIKSLNVPIATANYDNLLEEITHLSPITLLEKDRSKVQSFFNYQKQRYILHLHGHFREPDSIVLGQKSYNRIVADGYAQFINQFIGFHNEAVIFIGFGQGVYDPNFSLIFKWVSQNLPKTKIYHVVQNKDIPKTEKTHESNQSKNVFVVGYGETYQDLIPFLNAISLNLDTDEDLPKTLAGKPDCFGQNRLDLIQTVAKHIVESYKKPIGILGTGGLGKTNLVINILHEPIIARKYRKQRYFVRCDGAKDLPNLIATLANSLDIPLSGGDLAQQILNYLFQLKVPKLIVLDNFETPWVDAERVEPFIEKLKDHADLIITYRGNSSPDEVEWKTYLVPFLKENDALELFHVNSDEKFRENSLANQMVKEVDYLPLAVSLLAKRAKKDGDLERVNKEWKVKKNDFLKISKKEDNKDFNINLSISFSYENPIMNTENQDFLKAIAYLPNGIKYHDLESIFKETYDQITILKSLGLCEETEEKRIWVLAPIREYLKEKNKERNGFLNKIQDFYLKLGEKIAGKAIFENNENQRLKEEIQNIYEAIDDNISEYAVLWILVEIGNLFSHYNLDSLSLFEKAIPYTNIYYGNLKSNILYRYSAELNRVGRWKEAFLIGEEALKIAKEIKITEREIDALISLAVISLRIGKFKDAEKYYLEAYDLLQTIEKGSGEYTQEVNIILGISVISDVEKDFKITELKELVNKGLEIAKDNNSFLQIAQCKTELGKYEMYLENDDLAKSLLEEALEIYKNNHFDFNSSYCYFYLGQLAYFQNNNELCEEYILRAVEISEKQKSYLSMAEFFLRLSQFNFIISSFDKAKEYNEQAINIYKSIDNQNGVGVCFVVLAEYEKNELRKKEYLCQAKKVFEKADLQDRIKDFQLDEFECE